MKGEGPPTHKRTIPQHFRGSQGSQLPTSLLPLQLGLCLFLPFFSSEELHGGGARKLFPGPGLLRGSRSLGRCSRGEQVCERWPVSSQSLQSVCVSVGARVRVRACQRTDGKERAPDASATPAAAPAAAAARSQELP